MNHHTADSVCPLCEDKLKHAHEKLQRWFRAMKAHFDARYLRAVADHPLTADAEIRWGGNFRTIVDRVHFEV